MAERTTRSGLWNDMDGATGRFHPGERPRHLLIAFALTLTLAFGLVPALPAEANPLPLSTAELASPAVVQHASGRTDVFFRSSSGRLTQQHRRPGGSWSRELDRGGKLASQPAAVTWGDGRIDVFARGTDGTLIHRYHDGKWSSWQSLGGKLSSAPAVTSWSPGRMDVVVRWSDNTIRHRRYTTSGGWSSWKSLGGTLTSSPAIATWEKGRLDVVARGKDNAIWHKRYTSSGGWSSWRSLGGKATSQPAIAAPTKGHLDVFMRGTDDAVKQRTFAGGAWGSWRSRGGTFVSGPSASYVGGAVRIAARPSSTRINEATRSTPTASWGNWRRIDMYLPFRKLGTWVKVWDYGTLDPVAATKDMKAKGVRVLYLQTARFTTKTDFHDPVKAGQWLDAAHKQGIKVVGWYVPGYGDMERDVRRTVAISKFRSPGGQRFDAVGVDIEYFGSSGEVSRSTFYSRIAPHLDQVRKQVPDVIGAIVPPPFATKPGTYWDGFPWHVIGPRSEVVIPMAMWSNRTGYSVDQVYKWVKGEVEETRRLTGRPVMVEGGIGSPTNADVLKRVDAYVRGAKDGKAIGGAHWDYVTTRNDFWPILARLNE